MSSLSVCHLWHFFYWKYFRCHSS